MCILASVFFFHSFPGHIRICVLSLRLKNVLFKTCVSSFLEISIGNFFVNTNSHVHRLHNIMVRWQVFFVWENNNNNLISGCSLVFFSFSSRILEVSRLFPQLTSTTFFFTKYMFDSAFYKSWQHTRGFLSCLYIIEASSSVLCEQRQSSSLFFVQSGYEIPHHVTICLHQIYWNFEAELSVDAISELSELLREPVEP